MAGLPQASDSAKGLALAQQNLGKGSRWQLADGDRVTTYKTYHGTHEGTFLGVAPTQRKIHFETVDVMRVQNGKITDHWGVANLLSLMQQIGGWIPPAHGPQQE